MKSLFNLNEKLAEYCMSYSEILMHGILKMREEFLEITAPTTSNEESLEDLLNNEGIEDEPSDAENIEDDDEPPVKKRRQKKIRKRKEE